MPLALCWLGSRGGRVPILGERLTLGSGAEADVVVKDARLEAQHARLTLRKGEWVLAAEPGVEVWVNGARVPLFALRDGDVVDLVDPASAAPVTFRLEDRLAGAFVPPGTSRWAAWLASPASTDPAAGPEAYAGADMARDGRVARAHDPHGGTAALCCVALQGGLAGAEAALAPIARLAGAPHPGLALPCDLGVAGPASAPRLWWASRWVEGESADALLARGPVAWDALVRLLVAPARGLAWLHRRGLLHRAVSPDHLLVAPDGSGVLTGWRHATLYRRGAAPRRAAGPWLAPEERGSGEFAITPAVDAFALCAFALALLTGRAPDPQPERGAPRLPPLDAYPEALGLLLYEGLSPMPAHRPNAADAARRLEALDAAVGRDVP
jgi:hypothetical protein